MVNFLLASTVGSGVVHGNGSGITTVCIYPEYYLSLLSNAVLRSFFMTLTLIIMYIRTCPYMYMYVHTVHAKKKCPDFLSTYWYFLSTSVGTSEGTSVGTYCTVQLKHIPL